MRETTLTGMKRWFVSYEEDYDTMAASVYVPINGSHTMQVSVCTVEDLECEDNEGCLELVREGKGAERLKKLSMIVHAPDMLDCLRRSLEDVTKLQCLLDGKENGLTADETHDLWVKLCELERELDDCQTEADSTEHV